MPIVIDIRKDLRFQQGMEEGVSYGREKATNERNAAFVTYLLQHSSHSIEQIAHLVNVPVEFVMAVKSGMK